MSALRWADVDDAADGDGVLVTVRRGKTNQEGETRDVRFVKGAVAGAIRTLRRRPRRPRRRAPDGLQHAVTALDQKGEIAEIRRTAACLAAGALHNGNARVPQIQFHRYTSVDTVREYLRGRDDTGEETDLAAQLTAELDATLANAATDPADAGEPDAPPPAESQPPGDAAACRQVLDAAHVRGVHTSAENRAGVERQKAAQVGE